MGSGAAVRSSNAKVYTLGVPGRALIRLGSWARWPRTELFLQPPV